MQAKQAMLTPLEKSMVIDIVHRIAPGYRVWIYGSRARGDARQFSDLDLLIEGDSESSFRKKGELFAAFAESDLPYTVDIIDRSTVSKRFLSHIQNDLIPLFVFFAAVVGSFFSFGPVRAQTGAMCCLQEMHLIRYFNACNGQDTYKGRIIPMSRTLQIKSENAPNFSPSSQCRPEGISTPCASDATGPDVAYATALCRKSLDLGNHVNVDALAEKEVPCDYNQKCIQATMSITDCSQFNNNSNLCLANPNCFYYTDSGKCYNRRDAGICGEIRKREYCGEKEAAGASIHGSLVCAWDDTSGGIGSCSSRVGAGLAARYARSGGWLPACAYAGNCRSVNDLFEVAISVVEQAFKYIGAGAFLMFVYGGFTMIIAFGNAERFEHGKKILIAAVIGIIISFSAYILVDFILKALQVGGGIQGL